MPPAPFLLPWVGLVCEEQYGAQICIHTLLIHRMPQTRNLEPYRMTRAVVVEDVHVESSCSVCHLCANTSRGCDEDEGASVTGRRLVLKWTFLRQVYSFASFLSLAYPMPIMPMVLWCTSSPKKSMFSYAAHSFVRQYASHYKMGKRGRLE